MQNVGFVQRYAVAIHDSVAQMNPVAGHADDPLHHIHASRCRVRMQEDHDLAALRVAIGKQRPHPRSLGRKLDAVHEHMVADQQRVLHRTRRNLERLHHKRDDEQSGDQHRRQRRQKLDRGFLRLLVRTLLERLGLFQRVFFFRHCHVSVSVRNRGVETVVSATVEERRFSAASSPEKMGL